MKRIFLLVLLLMVSVTLISCGGGSNSNRQINNHTNLTPEPAPSPTPEPTPDPNGFSFYYPTVKKEKMHTRDWLKAPPEYTAVKNSFHSGHDIYVKTGTKVYALAKGKALLNKTDINETMHKYIWFEFELEDGSKFLAVYGHVNSTIAANTLVTAGQEVGEIADFDGKEHLHLGINLNEIEKVVGKIKWGTCVLPDGWTIEKDPNKEQLKAEAAAKGWVQPWGFLTTHKPAK